MEVSWILWEQMYSRKTDDWISEATRRLLYPREHHLSNSQTVWTLFRGRRAMSNRIIVFDVRSIVHLMDCRICQSPKHFRTGRPRFTETDVRWLLRETNLWWKPILQGSLAHTHIFPPGFLFKYLSVLFFFRGKGYVWIGIFNSLYIFYVSLYNDSR